jgi:HlyD family secretion protein
VLVAAFAAPACERPHSDRVQGYVEGEFVYVASPLAGELETLAVARGGRVQRGDPLFALESAAEKAERDAAIGRLAQSRADLENAKKGARPSEIESLAAQLTQVKASLALAEIELARQEKLVASNASSANDLDRARTTREQDVGRVAQLEADLQTAKLGAREDVVAAAEAEVKAREAALAKAEWDLAQKQQTATEDAPVFDTLFREGEWVPAGRPVVVLLPPRNVKVRAFVPQAIAANVHPGDAVLVYVDGVATPASGKVSFVSPQVEYTPPVIYSQESREKLVVMVEARFDDAIAERLHPGQPVDVAFAR